MSRRDPDAPLGPHCLNVTKGGHRRNEAQMAEEQRLSFQYRLQGFSYRQVADLVSRELGWGITKETVKRRIRDEAATLTDEDRATLLQVELARLDRYLVGLETTATDPSAKPAEVVAAIQAALRVSERRAKLLGLDSPEVQEVRHLDGQDVELATMIREEQARQAAEEAKLLAEREAEA